MPQVRHREAATVRSCSVHERRPQSPLVRRMPEEERRPQVRQMAPQEERRPPVLQMARAVAQEKIVVPRSISDTSKDKLILAAAAVQRAVPLTYVPPPVPVQMLSARSVPLDKHLQDKSEWAASILQKMQRKRVLTQRVAQAQEGRLQAITVPTLQRKSIMAHSACVGKVQYNNEPCRLHAASVLKVASLGKVMLVM